MTKRINYAAVSPEALRAMYGVERYARTSGFDQSLLYLVKLCASYINGCAYCVDMHSKDARIAGETEQRIYAVPVWRETPFYTDRERAALAYTEAVTALEPGGVSDEVFGESAEHFPQAELVALTMAIVAINSWNRVVIPFRVEPGSYQPNSAAAAAS